MKKLVLIIRVHEDGPRMNASSANQSRDPKGWSTTQGNVPGDSINTDKYHRSTG